MLGELILFVFLRVVRGQLSAAEMEMVMEATVMAMGVVVVL